MKRSQKNLATSSLRDLLSTSPLKQVPAILGLLYLGLFTTPGWSGGPSDAAFWNPGFSCRQCLTSSTGSEPTAFRPELWTWTSSYLSAELQILSNMVLLVPQAPLDAPSDDAQRRSLMSLASTSVPGLSPLGADGVASSSVFSAASMDVIHFLPSQPMAMISRQPMTLGELQQLNRLHLRAYHLALQSTFRDDGTSDSLVVLIEADKLIARISPAYSDQDRERMRQTLEGFGLTVESGSKVSRLWRIQWGSSPVAHSTIPQTTLNDLRSYIFGNFSTNYIWAESLVRISR